MKFKKVINADGRMTILGVSKFSTSVAEGIKYAGQNFFIMKDFKEQINSSIAKLIGSNSVHIVNSASAGISLSVAAAIYKDKIYDVNKLKIIKNEIIIAKGHNIDFGAPIENLIYLVGGQPKEAGFSNKCLKEDYEYQINENTAALMYVVSHHCVQKNMLSLNETIEISKKYKIPLIVDCAAEEDIEKYAKLDIDAVIFSGSKAIEGPTSGIVFGKNNELISNIKLHSNIIGRPMKIGKESIYGLYVALKEYKIKTEDKYEEFKVIFENNKFINLKKTIDERGIVRISFTIINSKCDANKLSKWLKENDPAIYLRDYLANKGILEIDLRNLSIEDAKIINDEIEKKLGEKNES